MGEAGGMRLSVALVTRDRPEALRDCLESLRAQGEQPWEIVVSDDSGEACAGVVRRVAESFGCRYVRGPGRGLYANRNAAALACRGTHVRTADDDHLFPEGHFARCSEAVEEDPGAVWTTGEVCSVEGRLLGEFPRAGQLHPAGVACPVENPDDNWAVADGSTIYPLGIWARGHRMEEAFPYGMSYLEFGAYLYRLGYRSRCVEGAMVEHRSGPGLVGRDRDRPVVESRVWAMFCYNRWFRPGRYRLARHLGAALVRAGCAPWLWVRLPVLWRMAAGRWAGLARGAGR